MTRPKGYVPPDSRKISVARKAVCVAARTLVYAPTAHERMAATTALDAAVGDLEDLDPPEYREGS